MKVDWGILCIGIGFPMVTSLATPCGCPSMSRFEFVDPSIVQVLKCPSSLSPTSFLTNDRIDFPETSNINDLVALAVECDQWIYPTSLNGDKLDAYSLSLAQFATSNSNSAMISTLLALNALEVAITCATSHRPGTAPLLTDMIAQLPCLGHACRLLLTPEGLNLRNLLWHGFVTDLPRPWLSLVLLLTRQLTRIHAMNDREQHQQQQPKIEPEQVPCCFDFSSHSAFKILLASARSDLLTYPPTLLRETQPWLPPSHYTVYQQLLPWITNRERPVTCCAVLTILLEHGLRLDWCHANQRPADAIARPRVFYVTLDGHGQRQQHDLLLHPYLGNTTTERNALLTIIPASTIALLTDLFCSSCGGPNIRSVLSHGQWDQYLMEEWIHNDNDDNDQGRLIHQEEMYWNVVRLLLLAMDSVASLSQLPTNYLPTFSYAAVTQKAIAECQKNLHQLIELPNTNPAYDLYAPLAQEVLASNILNVPNELMELQKERKLLAIMIPFLEQTCTATDRGMDTVTCWTTADIFKEHQWNLKLSKMGLTLNLLQDVAMASEQLQQQVVTALEQLSTANTRTRKGYLRLVYSSLPMALHLYILSFNVAILSLRQQDQDTDNDNAENDNETMLLLLPKALQRSRMVVSTTRTFLRSNVDRARKSIVEYTQGKAIRQVVKQFEPRV